MPYGFFTSRFGYKKIDERVLTGNIALDALGASVLCYGATAARTVTMPVQASVVGKLYTIFNKASTAAITFNTSTGGTIRALAAGKAIQIMVVGSTWRVFRGSTAA